MHSDHLWPRYPATTLKTSDNHRAENDSLFGELLGNTELGRSTPIEIEVSNALYGIKNLIYLIQTDPYVTEDISRYADLTAGPLRRLEQVLFERIWPKS